jgi:hypothetical protein
LVGVVTVLTGAAVLSPAAQDGVHAVYVPVAILLGALLLRRPHTRNPERGTRNADTLSSPG